MYICIYIIILCSLLFCLHFLPAHTLETEEQETKYCKWCNEMVTLLTREKLIQVTLASVWLEFIFYKINFEIN